MFLVGAISWWYGEGWKQRAGLIRQRLARTLDFFSIGLLLRTFFSPFRQISVGTVNGPLSVKLRALADKLISRLIGAGLRLVMIVTACLVLMLQVLFGGIILLVWGFVPLFPLIGVVLWTMGWSPTWNL
jgi:hypothetical protein